MLQNSVSFCKATGSTDSKFGKSLTQTIITIMNKTMNNTFWTISTAVTHIHNNVIMKYKATANYEYRLNPSDKLLL